MSVAVVREVEQGVQKGGCGFEQLIGLLSRGVEPYDLESYLEPAVTELEVGDRFSSEVTEELIELLLCAQEEMEGERSPEKTLAKVMLVYEGATRVGLEEVWRERAAALEPERLVTESWLGLKTAVETARAGHGHAVIHWIDRMEALCLQTWNDYQSLKLLQEEITRESVLGHLFLQEGLEHWLEALATLREYCAMPKVAVEQKVWEKAEEGQRLLLALQMVEVEQRWVRGSTRTSWN